MRLHVFLIFLHELRVVVGLGDSKHINLDEQAAIFLYMSVTGLSIRHVGERFQCSNETISKCVFISVSPSSLSSPHLVSMNLSIRRYYRKILQAVSSGPLYKKYVYLPKVTDPVDPFIRDQPRFFPFFDGALGAMDGTHINCTPSAAERHAARNRKGGVSQNCLACVSFGMCFQYILSGWEGLVGDASMYMHSHYTNLRIGAGKFYLEDAGFSICDSLMVPYRGMRYHLAEWGCAQKRCS